MVEKMFKIPTVDEMEKSSGEISSFSKYKKLDTGREFTEIKSRDDDSSSSIPSARDDEMEKSRFLVTSSSVTAARSVIVNGRQKGNAVLKYLRNVPWEWGDPTADYVMGTACCALFLSVKFHKLHPEYIHERFKKVGKSYALQVLFLQMDAEESDNTLRELNSMCFMAGWTLILTWSAEETAEYVESFKIYENKPSEFLMAKQQDASAADNERSKFVDFLTSIPSVNRTDAENLIEAFGSLKSIAEARVEDLALCQGFGLKKAQRLYDALGRNFTCESTELGEAGSSCAVDIGLFQDDDEL